jgi:hypothetical protein
MFDCGYLRRYGRFQEGIGVSYGERVSSDKGWQLARIESCVHGRVTREIFLAGELFQYAERMYYSSLKG